MVKDLLNLPVSGGGLMRYNEEYKSKIILKPTHVIIFVILVLLLVISLKIFFPVA